MTESDPYVGETYADGDPRSEGRVVRVVERYEVSGRNATPARYIVEVIKHNYDDTNIGRRSVVSASTLDTRYRKVSQ